MTALKKDIKELRPIHWNQDEALVYLIDQKLLPYEFSYQAISSHEEMATAIRDMTVRGAPAIGIAAAFGMALAAKNNQDLNDADTLLRGTRPTAVNLMWALDEIKKVIDKQPQDLYQAILEQAKFILEDDIKRCKTMAQVGADYIKNKFQDKIAAGQKLKIMTHCNAGALATGGYGTALGLIRRLHEEDLVEMVFADETRPRQQGARLTAWELAYDHIPTTLNTDNMAAHLIKTEAIDFVIVGSDRITANGDAANKIGTYQLAITAQYHKLPFYVAAPMSTVDMSLSHGGAIPIEERDHSEVSHINGQTCTVNPSNLTVENYDLQNNSHRLGEISYKNPGFDVTPNSLIEAIFTEKGLFEGKV